MSAVLPPEAPPDAGSQHGPDEKPSAAQRLAESRERLRLWMVRGDARHEARQRVAAAEAQGDRPAMMDRLHALPGVGAVIDALSAWWEHHPLQPAAELARGVVQERFAPVARRHPLLVVAAAFAAGAALVRFKPWRWFARPALAGGLLAQIISIAISRIPFESWIGALAAFGPERARAPAQPTAEPAAQGATPYPEAAPAQPGRANPPAGPVERAWVPRDTSVEHARQVADVPS